MEQKVVCPFGYGPRIHFLWTPCLPVVVFQLYFLKLGKGGENTKKESERKMWFPLIVTFVMVTGAFVVMAPAPGSMTQVGDRGGDFDSREHVGEAVSFLDMIENEQESYLQLGPATGDSDELETLGDSDLFEFAKLDEPVTVQENRVEVVNVEFPDEGTRSPGVDANGPYGGPDTFEGATITFTCTADDPSLIFFRWDFDNDAAWDTEWRFSFTMSDTIDHMYDDDYYGLVVCEAWDGISTQTIIITGNALNEVDPDYYWITRGWRNTGWKFRAKLDLEIKKLGAFRWNTYARPYNAALWDASSQARLATCSLPSSDMQWNWCSIPTVKLEMGKWYMISARWYCPNGPLMKQYPDVNEAVIEPEIGVYYYYSSGIVYPRYGPLWAGQFTPVIDFEFYFKEVILLTESDTAKVTVNNIAPDIFDFQVTPTIGREGEPVDFSAKFEDAGLADDWKYRVHFGDGNVSDWKGVKKYLGGADVLILHSTTGQISFYKPRVIEACGAFCKSVDDYNIYTSGAPDFDYLMEYDVILFVSNYPLSGANELIGDMLADYMDLKGDEGSGGVVAMWDAFDTGTNWDIRGRWFDDEYSPLKKAGRNFRWKNMGPIFVPGHPLLDGVSSMRVYYTQTCTQITPGAVKIANFDYRNYIMIATKENPIVDNGARAVALPWFPYNARIDGDWARLMVNAIRWSSRMPDPTVKPMPITLDPISYAYMDDNPTTTPFDTYDATIEIWDDDHGKVIIERQDVLYTQDFQTTCGYNTWPSGWSAHPGVWHCGYSSYLESNAALNWYYYQWVYGNLQYDVSFDMSDYTFVQFGWTHDLRADYTGGETHALVQGSIDGGASYPYVVREWHHPPTALYDNVVTYLESCPWAAGQTDVRFRFRVYDMNDWWWHVDDIYIEGLVGDLVEGSDTVIGQVIIENVEPGQMGGQPSSTVVDELGEIIFQGYKVSDPALWIDTEWFAYKWEMDDGTTEPWIYKGTMAPPKNTLKVLFIHSYCYTNVPNCETGDAGTVKNMIEAHESVAYVDLWDLFNRLVAPSMSTMLNYDIVMYGTNWAWLFDPQWTRAREDVGDRFADFLDMKAGGVVTVTPTYDTFNNNIFRLLGRYMDDEYGPYIHGSNARGSGAIAEIFYPEHYVMRDIEVGSVSNSLWGGSYSLTEDALTLAAWGNGAPAVGVKQLGNGARDVHLNGFGPRWGGVAFELFGNALLWAWGKAPSPEIQDFTYVYGDNGVYNVDLMVVDDDMGWIWDGTDLVAAPGFTPTISHSYTPITVSNVDPTILTMGAYMEIEACIRMTGNKGNMATLTITGSDGTYETVTAVREPGNPVIACLPEMTIDVSTGTTYDVTIEYDPADDDGANPTWIFSGTFPDGKVKELRKTFQSDLGFQTWAISNKEFKRMGIGQEISFEASASDPGSDDLAFVWVWGDRTPYTICIYEHPGVFLTCADSDYPEELPFNEPRFTVSANSLRSPEVDPIFASDLQTHVFGEEYFYYVTLIVMDDDINDRYPSLFSHPGSDMDFLEIDW